MDVGSYHDEVLGDLRHFGRHWKGSIVLEQPCAVELILPGVRSAPDSESLALARELPGKYSILRLEIQAKLFEHYEPYRQAVTEEVFRQHFGPFPEIGTADAVWSHVAIAFVRIEPLRTTGQIVDTIEIAFNVDWDEEHTVGARIQKWRVVELCGSV